MTLPSVTEILPLVAWLLALAQFITALYLLAHNVWHTANRHVSALCLLLAINSFATGHLIRATGAAEASVPTYLLAGTSATVPLFLILASVAVLRPDWLSPQGDARWFGVRRWLWSAAYLVAFLPLLLTAADVILPRKLWYTGLEATAYTGGYVPASQFTSGTIALPVRVTATCIAPALTLVIVLYVALRDRKTSTAARRVAWLLVAAQIAAAGLHFEPRRLVTGALSVLIVSALFAAVYSLAAIHELMPGTRIRRGRLQTRLAALTLTISVPMLVGAVAFGSFVARELTATYAQEHLKIISQSVRSDVAVWLAMTKQELERLVSLPGIISMDPAQQGPILEAAAATAPQSYLICTTDLHGTNLARSDGADPQDYGDQTWFQGARDGAPVVLQSLVDPSTGKPALVTAMPIRDPDGETVGVGMLATTLGELGRWVDPASFGETGIAYIVDVNDQALTHPDQAVSGADTLVDLSDSPPIASLRAGSSGLVAFTQDGHRWYAFVDEADHGWGVVVQQQESDLFAGLEQYQRVAAALMIGGGLALCVLTWFAVRWAILPINTLIKTVSSVSDGDLTGAVPIESEDEVGALAGAFNNIMGRLRELIASLEERIYRRTIDLEHRTRFLEATAQVARESTSVLEPRELLERVARLISERFGFYHTGIFLLDQSREWAVLQATSSEGGQRMLARGHQLKAGRVGIVGTVAAQGEPRVAHDTGEDAVSFDNPDLPETRSQLALPLRARGEVLGVLDVQSSQPGAFSDQDIEVLQILADQVAMAVSNARLFHQTQTALQAERRAYGHLRQEAWQQTLQTQTGLTYFCDERGVRRVGDPANEPGTAGLPELTMPISLGDQTLGTLQVHRDQADQWTTEEIALLRTLADQLGLALENARLFGDSQRRAAQEQLVSEVALQLRGSLDVDTVLQTAVREIGDALGLSEVQVRLKGDRQRERFHGRYED